MPSIRSVLGFSTIAALFLTGPALAQRGGWRMPGAYGPVGRGADPREGKVEAAHFIADSPAASALGHGGIAVSAAPGTMATGLERETYEAAVVDQLAKVGYDTATGPVERGQVAELIVTHDVVQPEEPPHRPVSGEGTVGVSNRGTFVGMAVDVDLSKPLKALMATRLEARIRDKATNTLLWEGHAEIVTREGDHRWTTQTLAARLAAALFKDFRART